MQIELTQSEHAFLVSILEERQREMLRQISRAGHHSFREPLRESEVMLESLLRKLSQEPAKVA